MTASTKMNSYSNSNRPFAISVVATLYYSEKYVVEFCRRAIGAVRRLTDNYEVILVNDGSPDSSLRIAKDCADRLENIVVIDLSRNFGHHHAIMAGLSFAKGDYIFLVDADLEEEPEWLLKFFPLLTQNECDVVYGVQGTRRGGWLERITGGLYYHIFRLLTGLPVASNQTTARLMSFRYVQSLLAFREREIDIATLWLCAGYDQRPCHIVKHLSSPTTYTLSRKVRLLVDSITSYSNRPLLMIFYIGTTLSLMSGTYAAYLIVNHLFFEVPLQGWTSLMVSIWLVGGLIIAILGIIGVYLAKVFSETKRRPCFIVRELYSPRTSQTLTKKEYHD